MSKVHNTKGKLLPNKYNNKQSTFQITASEAALLRKYLIEVILSKYSLTGQALQEIYKLSAKEYQQINLSDRVYDTLLNYCVLKLDASNHNHVMLFKRLLDEVGDEGLQYGHGDREYTGNNLSMMSDLKPLEVAIYARANKFAYILAERGYGTKYYEEGSTALHLAVNTANLKLVGKLSALPGIDFNCKDSAGYPPLFDALMGMYTADFYRYSSIAVKYKKIAIKLIELGASVNFAVNKEVLPAPGGNTLLHSLIEHDCVDLLQLAQDNGADLNIVDSVGNSLVHHAIIYKRYMVLEYLLNQGYGLNDCNEFHGYTTLDLLASRGMHEFIELAIDKGANANDRNEYDSSALDYAIIFLQRDNTDHDRGVETINTLFKKGYVLSDTDNKRLCDMEKVGAQEIVCIVREASKKYSPEQQEIERLESTDVAELSEELLDGNEGYEDEIILSEELLEGYSTDEELSEGDSVWGSDFEQAENSDSVLRLSGEAMELDT